MKTHKIPVLVLALLAVILPLLLTGCSISVTPNSNSAIQTNAGNPDKESSDNEPESGFGNSISEQPFKVHFIDVGQGDCILVQTGGQNMLIDAGEREYGDDVVTYLQNQGITTLDIVVATHPHSDHIGGLIKVLDTFAANKIYMPKITHTTQTFKDLLTVIQSKGLKISTARAGVIIPLKDVNAQFLAPVKSSYESLNDYSAVIKLVHGNHSFLFTGDAEKESEYDILENSTIDLKADVLKVCHHGSKSSNSQAFLNAVKPNYAVIQCGQDNDYGHPHKETITKLNNAKVAVYRTDYNGTIVFAEEPDGSFVINCERE